MSRWIFCIVCSILGLFLLTCGLVVPAHLRAVNHKVIERAGRNTPSIVEHGQSLLEAGKLGAAQVTAQAALQRRMPGADKLAAQCVQTAAANPQWNVWGIPDMRFDALLWADPKASNNIPQPVTEMVLRLENRLKILAFLRVSPRASLQELIRSRGLTNTVLFPPSLSASGQAYDAAVSVCGLLADAGDIPTGLRDAVTALATEANRTGKSQRLETAMLDFMLLGQKFNYGQLAAFLERVEDPETLHLLASATRRAGDKLPTLFTAVQVSGQPAAVGKYLATYSRTGLDDLAATFGAGAGGVKELVTRNQRFHSAGWIRGLDGAGFFKGFVDIASDYSLTVPHITFGLKALFLLAGGVLLAMAIQFAWPTGLPSLETSAREPTFNWLRELLFASMVLLLVLLLTEPFLSPENQKADLTLRFSLPIAGLAAAAAKTTTNTNMINQFSIMTLLFFFVLQALIYTACLVKLNEIRKEDMPARTKLRLLENEDHLFDAGLYIGFVGTIISLILVSLGIIKPSLMAAYSSTSFGIIFVSIFKIFNLRPLRRKLVLDSDPDLRELADPEAFRTTVS